MRVGYELTALQLDTTGSARAIERLRLELEKLDGLDLVPLAHPGGGLRYTRGLTRELVYLPIRLPRRSRRMGLDVLHCPAPLGPLVSKVPVVLTLNDVMTFDHPEWFTRANVLQQRLTLRRAARNARVVLTPSEYSRDRAVEVLGLDPDRVRVTPYGIDDRFHAAPADPAVLNELGVSGRYALTVGTLQPRKNIGALLRAFAGLDGLPQRLVVVGASGWGDRDERAVLEGGTLGDRVHWTGRVSDRQLIELYRGADCFVFLSRYEGFGFPPLEAMACGTAVVCSGGTSLTEVTGGAARLVDPDDVDEIGRALEEVLGSQDLRQEMSTRGRRQAGTYSWTRCARLTADAYRVAAGG